ncbi:hypothetical protein PUF88_05145 [Lactobacillaceae bacterium L1_55_11]|nr:hypothetical protein [Lactobacillaceae bacterium L1_55_11]
MSSEKERTKKLTRVLDQDLERFNQANAKKHAELIIPEDVKEFLVTTAATKFFGESAFQSFLEKELFNLFPEGYLAQHPKAQDFTVSLENGELTRWVESPLTVKTDPFVVGEYHGVFRIFGQKVTKKEYQHYLESNVMPAGVQSPFDTWVRNQDATLTKDQLKANWTTLLDAIFMKFFDFEQGLAKQGVKFHSRPLTYERLGVVADSTKIPVAVLFDKLVRDVVLKFYHEHPALTAISMGIDDTDIVLEGDDCQVFLSFAYHEIIDN